VTVLEEVSARADARIAEVGALLGVQVPELSAALLVRLTSAIEPLQGEETLQGLLYASIESNLESMVHLMRYDIPVSESTPPAAAAEYARRLAQRGISSTALIRAYRLGQQLVVDWAFEQFAKVESDPEVALVAGRRFAELTFAYVDTISEGVVGEYENERDRWLGHRSALRAGMIEQLIAGGEVNTATAERAMGYRLRQQHVGVVLWTDDSLTDPRDPHDRPQLEQLLTAIAHGLGATSKPLLHARDSHQAWGWVPLGRGTALPDMPVELHLEQGPGVRACVGTPAPGAEGFRTSHLEAVRGQCVARMAGAAAPAVTWFGTSQVRIAALLAADPEFARRMVVGALGGLAVDTEAAARLRETLLVFLTERGSYLAASERLHLHKNTVKYRVERAIEERGRPLDDERFELECALVASRWLGASVLASAPLRAR
jgi:hypothetical protein